MRDTAYYGITRYAYNGGSGKYLRSYFHEENEFGENSYWGKKSGQSKTINSWNQFMQKITTDESAYLKPFHFSARA